jgi:soluble lytic murein transglycosylase-like protein
MARRLALPIAFAAASLAGPAAASAAAPVGVASPGTGGAAIILPSGGAAPGQVRPPEPEVSPAPVRPGAGAREVPRGYLRLYRRAARRYGVDWRVLAAIGKNESDHGRSRAPGVRTGLNFADCCAGPMQICTVTSCGRVWQHYAIDANGDGRRSVYDPADAIHASAAIVRDLQSVFGRNRPRFLLAGYNAGAAAVQRHRGVPDYPETQAYVAAGLRYMKLLGR